MNARRPAPDTWAFLATLVVTAAVYAPVLGYATIPTWDDTTFVVHRPEILDWWGVSWRDRLVNPIIGYPIPIPTALYAFLRSITDDYFGLLHGIHVVVHLLNTWAVWRLAKRWLPGPWMAVATAAAWALHPVNVESVAWLTNTKTLLTGTAILGALNLQARVRDSELNQALGLEGPRWWNRPGTYALALVALFLLGIGSRPDAAILPWVLFAAWFAREGFKFFKHLGENVRKFRPATPAWFGTLMALQVVSLPYVWWASSTHANVAERNAQNMSAAFELFFRVGRAAELSMASMVWPAQLHPSYFYDANVGWIDALPGVAMLALVGGIGVWAWTSGRHAMALGAVLFAATYLPYANFVYLPRLAADTYLYLPVLGLTVMFAAALPTHRIALIVWGFLPVMWMGLTWNQVQRWENAATLWEPVIAYEPDGDRSYRHLAFHHYSAGRVEEALAYVDAGLPHFAAAREIPWYAVEIVRAVRGPLAAAELGVRALVTNVKVDPLLQKAVVETLLLGKIPMPPNPEAQRVILEAFSAYQNNPEWMANPSAKPAIDAYLGP